MVGLMEAVEDFISLIAFLYEGHGGIYSEN
jgi:hypothetical protein